MATLISMELSAAEAKQETMPTESEAPKYPWGLCITLDDDALKKLGIDKLPDIGSKMRIVAVADVSAVRSYAEQGGEADTSVDLQITEMAIDAAADDTMQRAAGALYGK
jgi:hypothetical protein